MRCLHSCSSWRMCRLARRDMRQSLSAVSQSQLKVHSTRQLLCEEDLHARRQSVLSRDVGRCRTCREGLDCCCRKDRIVAVNRRGIGRR